MGVKSTSKVLMNQLGSIINNKSPSARHSIRQRSRRRTRKMSVPRVVIHVLSAVQVILGFAIAAASIWFYSQIYELTSLRNTNHYLLDYNVYWPQAVPWMFFIIALFVIGAAACGFASAKRKNRELIAVYIVVLSIVIVCLIAASVIALVFADSKSSADFVKDTIWDVYFQSKTDNDVATSFGLIERKLHCCGSDGPRDYKNWKSEFPMSCCDVYYHGWLEPYAIDCDFTNKLANERHGCSTVAVHYSRIIIYVLSAVALLTALLGVFGIVSAVTLYKKLKIRNHPPPRNESESKKVLL